MLYGNPDFLLKFCRREVRARKNPTNETTKITGESSIAAD
jgi:hypothetical protein